MSTRWLRIALAGGLALAVVVWITGQEAPSDPRTEVERTLNELVAAAEAKDVGGVLGRISKRFRGRGGMGRNELRGLLFTQLRRGRWNRILLADTEIALTSDRLADVTTFALLARGEGVLPSEADGYTFDLVFAKEDDEAWRVIEADWHPGRGSRDAPSE